MGSTRRQNVSTSAKARTGPVKETVAPPDDDEITPEDLKKWARETWREDRIWELPAGFTLVEKGRDGAIYYRRGNSVVEFTWEFSGVASLDILIWEDTASIRWIDVHSFECKPVSPKDRELIKQQLIAFLLERGARFSLDNKSYRARRPIALRVLTKKRP